MFSFSPDQGLVEHILVNISWDYGWKLCEKKKMILYEKNSKVAKGERKKKKKKEKEEEKCSIVLLKFYVDGA
jgi:hypothetical protein